MAGLLRLGYGLLPLNDCLRLNSLPQLDSLPEIMAWRKGQP
jgi:hypothetical protein